MTQSVFRALLCREIVRERLVSGKSLYSNFLLNRFLSVTGGRANCRFYIASYDICVMTAPYRVYMIYQKSYNIL